MRRTLRAAVSIGALSLTAVTGVAPASSAATGPVDCTTGVVGGTVAYAECPASAGDFEFRVVAQSGGIAGHGTVYGPWLRPAPDVPVRSAVSCQGAPKCAAFSPVIEVR
ncbi:hypothetical protein [Streptomyces macrosporus]|uniref:Secreted protein n=1 Tax=Streptomyces macrosporus TaxID=44032 RepID=A0ABN3K521_9ACTN